ncbi:hypothetical protein, partial [Mesotoga prima]|uniref:hypothetical protein n=1 Tax=Mesotoga prima TaxID=1184387 RepID=UPI002FD9725D
CRLLWSLPLLHWFVDKENSSVFGILRSRITIYLDAHRSAASFYFLRRCKDIVSFQHFLEV